jgi:hypothetical protein
MMWQTVPTTHEQLPNTLGFEARSLCHAMMSVCQKEYLPEELTYLPQLFVDLLQFRPSARKKYLAAIAQCAIYGLYIARRWHEKIGWTCMVDG